MQSCLCMCKDQSEGAWRAWRTAAQAAIKALGPKDPVPCGLTSPRTISLSLRVGQIHAVWILAAKCFGCLGGCFRKFRAKSLP